MEGPLKGAMDLLVVEDLLQVAINHQVVVAMVAPLEADLLAMEDTEVPSEVEVLVVEDIVAPP